MGIQILKQKNEIETSEKQLLEILSEKLINKRKISIITENYGNLDLIQYYSLSYSTWFARYKNDEKITYYFGDKNKTSVLNNDNTTWKPNFSISFNTEKFAKGNGRFANDNEVQYVLLKVELENVNRTNLIKNHFPIIKLRIKNSDKIRYFLKLNLKHIIKCLDIITKNFTFNNPFDKNLKIKSIDTYGLSQDLTINKKIKKEPKNTPEKQEKPKTLKSSDYNECEICGKKLRKNQFYKLPHGEYTKYCKKCSEKITAAKYLKEILKHIKPEEIILPEKLENYYSPETIKENINTLIENNLAIKDSLTGLYQLETQEKIDLFLKKYDSINQKSNEVKHEDKTKDLNKIPPKKSNGQYSLYTGVSYNIIAHKWFANRVENGKMKVIGYYKTEEEAHNAREEYIKKYPLESEKNPKNSGVINEVIKKNNNQYSEHKGVTFDRTNGRWRAIYHHNGERDLLGSFKTEEEAYQTRKNYIKNLSLESAENQEINEFQPKKNSKGQYSKFTGVSYNKSRGKWASNYYENNKKIFIGSFDTEEEAYNARKLFLKNKQEEKDKLNKKLDNLEIKNENIETHSTLNFFINYLGDRSEILLKGTLKNEDAFNVVTKLTPINSEIQKVLIDNNGVNSDIFIDIKLKMYNLTYITQFLKELGWNQKNSN